MIDLKNMWTIARAETRLTRRLARFWVFGILTLIMGLLFWGYYTAIHYFASAWSGTISMITPRFLLSWIGNWCVILFQVGLVFLAMDVRHRDQRDRISEVFDALPVSNLELLLGKFLGVLIPSWMVLFTITVFMMIMGLLTGTMVQPQSVVMLLIPMVIPAYTFTAGLMFLLTFVLKNRWIAAVAMLGILIAMVWISMAVLPMTWVSALDVTGAFQVPFASDLTPRIIEGFGIFQRLGVFLMGLGMIALAAIIHPRRDDSSRVVLGSTGGALIVVGLVLIGLGVVDTQQTVANRAHWREVHGALVEAPAPDVIRIDGGVDIKPGKSLALDLQMEIGAPEGAPLDLARFSLNPGIKVTSIESGSGQALQFEQEDGLVEISLASPLSHGSTTTLHWKAVGKPDLDFAYLDAAFEVLNKTPAQAQVVLMGFDAVVFKRDFVALLPGGRWLPHSGSDVGRSDSSRRARDFFETNLLVSVPKGFVPAGPGKRKEEGGAYRFNPGAPVPEVTLIAGKFESRSIEIDGVTFELLVHEKHTDNIDIFLDAGDALKELIAERFATAKEVGLEYPYDGLTMVEVPNYLRGYGGGWRMATTFAQPGLLLTRESGMPTARFAPRFKDASRFEDEEGGIGAAKIRTLAEFFENDFSGGNAFMGASENFFKNQVAGTGDVALPLNYVSEVLANRLIMEREGYFSVHQFDKDMNATINRSIGTLVAGGGENVAETIIEAMTSRVEVWDALLLVGLAQMDPTEDPKRALDVLTIKGGAMADSMIDGLGRETTGKFLAALRDAKQGDSFSREDVIAAGREVGIELDEWIDVWITGTDLPGFVVRDVRTYRIEDSDEGQPRYQTLLTVQNNEDVPGLLRIRHAMELGGGSVRAGSGGATRSKTTFEDSEPIRVEPNSAIRFGLVTPAVPESVRVKPYLSLNRGEFAVLLPDVDEDLIDSVEPIIGTEPAEWQDDATASIVVDDLDEGFSVVDEAPKPWWQFGDAEVDEKTDGGLPVMSSFNASSRWSRAEMSRAYGTYRHTAAIVRKGDGDRRAIFATDVERAGAWELGFHLPPSRFPSRSGRKSYNLTVVDASGEQAVTFDAENAEPGWNSLGEFELAEGEVKVIVSNETDGRAVIADAIRWTPRQRPPAPADASATNQARGESVAPGT